MELNEAITKAKRVMEHNSLLQKAVPIARKLGVVHFLHAVGEKANQKKNSEAREEFKTFYEKHTQEFRKLAELLEDDFSRLTLERVIEYRKTQKMRVLKGIIVEPQYFQKDIFGPVENEVFVDGGAYVGDTIRAFSKTFHLGGAGYKKIYAWEPDKSNLLQLERNLRGYHDLIVLPYGLWNEKCEIGFSEDGTSCSKLDKSADQKIQVDTIDHLCAKDKITFIKMDIEGSEIRALEGATQVIKRDKPRLAICIYHSPEDLYEIPFWIKNTVSEYKLYIRHHSDSSAETVVYATT